MVETDSFRCICPGFRENIDRHVFKTCLAIRGVKCELARRRHSAANRLLTVVWGNHKVVPSLAIWVQLPPWSLLRYTFRLNVAMEISLCRIGFCAI